MGLGITQLFVGVLCIIFNSVGINFGAQISVGSIGIWGGILFIINGAFGMSAAKSGTKCKIITFMVLSIISAGITVPLFICAVIGAVIDDSYFSCYRYNYNTYNYDRPSNCLYIQNVAIAMNSLLAILAIIEAIAATWGSAICCKAVCCCSTIGNQQMLAPIQYATIQGQPVIIIPQMNFGGQTVVNYPPQGHPVQGHPLPGHPVQLHPLPGHPPPEYSTQPIVNVSAPPYPMFYGQDTASGMNSQSYNGPNGDMEKQPL